MVQKFGDYGLSQQREFFDSEEGQKYLEGLRALIAQMFAWGLEVSDTIVGGTIRGLIDPRRSAALSELVRLGEIEVDSKTPLFTGDGESRTFVRRRLS